MNNVLISFKWLKSYKYRPRKSGSVSMKLLLAFGPYGNLWLQGFGSEQDMHEPIEGHGHTRFPHRQRLSGNKGLGSYPPQCLNKFVNTKSVLRWSHLKILFSIDFLIESKLLKLFCSIIMNCWSILVLVVKISSNLQSYKYNTANSQKIVWAELCNTQRWWQKTKGRHVLISISPTFALQFML